jgi:hypothetical protein
MLYDFLTKNRDTLIAHCREKAARRFEPSKTPGKVNHGVPLFLQQVVDTLRLEKITRTRDTSEPEPAPAPNDIGRAAALHGAELLRLGYTVDQVVHDYGDVCQSVTELAVKEKATISAEEFRTLNRCLDNAIADAVTAFGHDRQIVIDEQAETLHERLDFFSKEQQRLLGVAIQSYSAIRTGNIGMNGATGTLLINTLEELRYLANHALPEIRLASAVTTIRPVQP